MNARTRKVLAGVAVVVGLPLLGCVGLMADIASSFPQQQGARIDGGHFVGVETEGSYAWVIPSNTGVVLIDAGMDPAASALEAEIGGRTVHAVLITHGHLDHVGGLGAIEPLITYVGPGERGIAQGTERPAGLMQSLLGPVMAYPDPPPKMVEIGPDRILEIDGLRIKTVHMPGHTPGSTAYVVGDTVFTGDAALGHPDSIEPVHWSFSADDARARRSLGRLEGMADRMADGHAGLHDDLQGKLGNSL